jgi:hypothetical protein
MDPLTGDVVAGIIVAIMSGIGGFLVKSRFFSENVVRILPKAIKHVEKQNYGHLQGKWYLYWLSYDPKNSAKPVWLRGIQEIKVDQLSIRGTTELVDHPVNNMRFIVQGEIRGGRMINTDLWIEDETEFAVVVYFNLRPRDTLVGIWTGVDNLLRPIAAPAILSRNELDAKDLNEILLNTDLVFMNVDKYELQPYSEKHNATDE